MMHIDLCLLDLVPSMSKISRSLQEIVGGKSQSQSLNTTRPRPSSSVPGPSGWSMMVDGQIWEAFWGLGACLSMLNTRFMNSWFVQLGDTCLGADYPHPWVFSTRVSMDCMGDFFFSPVKSTNLQIMVHYCESASGYWAGHFGRWRFLVF